MSYFGSFFGEGFYGPFFTGGAADDPCIGPTLATAQADLARRLQDTSFVRWTANECTFYLQEAIYTWQTWTQTWRARGTIVLPLATPFVDLSAALPTLRGAYVTNWYLVSAVQYALLEPAAAGGTWTGTAQFSLTQISTALQRRRDQFLRETGIVLTRQEVAYPAVATSGRVTLPACTLQVQRAAWRDTATGRLLPLRRADDWSATAFAPTWTTPGVPVAYGTSSTAPRVLQIYPPPDGPGTLDLVTVAAGDPIDSATDAALGIPNDYAWVLKYGVLADLLGQDGLAFDPARAQYAEARWQQGVELARRQAVCLAASIAASADATPTPCQIGSLADADAYAPTWQLLAGRPRTVLLAGQNLLGIWPPAGGGTTYTLTVDLVRTPDVPLVATDRLVVTPDIYDTILDLAQHIALFKEGPGQVEQALPLLERAARAAGIDLELQQAAQPARAAILGQQAQDTRTSARRLSPVPQEAS